ncbi:glycosyl transferase [Arthrobacter flavus]|uniref:Glycosyl transferase n=1 Tax=Arthrobacter flavus TaxID=95172 RepID=A0ABW4Q8U2_9MICC
MTSFTTSPQVVVSLGTDHHKFDRLVDWIDDWLAATPSAPSCLVQHGASRAPRYAQGIDRMPRQELLGLYSSATVVVVQGGPGSILDAREVGHLPIAIARRPELNEVVDGHQIAFSNTMARYGNAIVVGSPEALMRAVDGALKRPESVRTDPRISGAHAAALKLDQAIRELEQSHRKPIALRRIRQLMTHR